MVHNSAIIYLHWVTWLYIKMGWVLIGNVKDSTSHHLGWLITFYMVYVRNLYQTKASDHNKENATFCKGNRQCKYNSSQSFFGYAWKRKFWQAWIFVKTISLDSTSTLSKPWSWGMGLNILQVLLWWKFNKGNVSQTTVKRFVQIWIFNLELNTSTASFMQLIQVLTI